jgi:metal-responsive CopG/Arc/MetJ family transcriptional regulator
MRSTVTVSIPRELKKELDLVVKEKGTSRSDVVRDCLKDYLWLCKFRRLRAKVIPYAQARGIFTDEDVFEMVS